MAKITLIQPPHIFPETAMKLRTSSPPLGLAYIAGALKAGNHHVHVIDSVGPVLNTRRPTEFEGHYATGLTTSEIIAMIPHDTEIIGISAMFASDWKNTKVIAQEARKKFPSIVIMLGGEQVSSEPEHSLRSTDADLAVIGEGEETALDIADRFHNSQSLSDIPGTYYHDRAASEIIQNPRRKRVRNIDEIPRPAWELFPIHAYLQRSVGTTAWDKSKISMIMSRGCPYQCTFCSSPTMWGTNWFPRNADQVVEEIRDYKTRYNIDHVEFNDLTAVINKKWTIDFAEKLIAAKLKITWSMPSGTRTEIMDGDLLKLLKESGLNNFSYAPESGSERILKKIKKRINKEKMLNSIEACKKLGIVASANMIIGFPGETHKDVWASLWFMIRMAWRGLDDVYLAVYCPFPGTELYKEVIAKYENDPKKMEDTWMQAMDTNYFNPTSHSEHIASKALVFYSFFMLSCFYTAQYLFHPVRIFTLMKNVLFKYPRTTFEAFIYYKILRKTN